MSTEPFPPCPSCPQDGELPQEMQLLHGDEDDDNEEEEEDGAEEEGGQEGRGRGSRSGARAPRAQDPGGVPPLPWRVSKTLTVLQVGEVGPRGP